MFSWIFLEYLKIPFFVKHLRTAAAIATSERRQLIFLLLSLNTSRVSDKAYHALHKLKIMVRHKRNNLIKQEISLILFTNKIISNLRIHLEAVNRCFYKFWNWSHSFLKIAVTVWGHPFGSYAKFSWKLKFLTPWYAHVRMRIRG